jgi:probable selenium-dependent hydroxylase accessory protein YqeC
MVVAMMGLEAISARLDEATVFRLEQVRSITGIETGGILAPRALSRVFLLPAGLFKGAPEGARRVVFLNKEDLVEEDTRAVELADILLADPMKKIDRVILGSIKKGEYETRAK